MIVYIHRSIQGLYSLNGKTSYGKISWSLKLKDLGFNISNNADISRHISSSAAEMPVKFQWYNHHNIQSRSFETSRDLAVRSLTAKWIVAQAFQPS